MQNKPSIRHTEAPLRISTSGMSLRHYCEVCEIVFLFSFITSAAILSAIQAAEKARRTVILGPIIRRWRASFEAFSASIQGVIEAHCITVSSVSFEELLPYKSLLLSHCWHEIFLFLYTLWELFLLRLFSENTTYSSLIRVLHTTLGLCLKSNY